jgi:replication factor C small subunit
MAQALWENKYRPKTIEDYLFQDSKQKDMIENFIKEKNIPHLIFTGHSGTGKTTLAYVLKNELGIDDSDFLKINASDENNVDTIRNLVKGFISTYSMSEFKLVLLDEADWLSASAQASLRTMMEDYADNARFILTCNRGNKIIPALKDSRCLEILFKKMDKQDMLERLAIILVEENVKASLDTLLSYVDISYPDMRNAIKLIQHNSINHVLREPSEMDVSTEVNLEIVQLMEANKYTSIRDVLSSKMSDDDWGQMYTFLYTYMHEIGKFSDEKKWKAGIVILAEHLYKHGIVADPEINATAMFIRLGDI